MGVNDEYLDITLHPFRPKWPATVDPSNARVEYDPSLDELLVWFDHSPRVASVPIETPGRDYVFVLVDEDTEAVVGIQVDNLVADVGGRHPAWLALARPGAVEPSSVGTFVADVARLFAQYGAGGA